MIRDIFPGKKTDAADYYEQRYDDIHHGIGFISGERRKLSAFISEKIKTRVAECGYGVEYCQPDAFCAVVFAKREQKGNCAD